MVTEDGHIGAHPVTSIVASCRKGQKSQKPNHKFQGQERSKKAKFDLFGFA